MRSFHRLPPLLRALLLVWQLTFLASLGVSAWAWRLGHESGKSPVQLYVIAWALLEIGLACSWPVAAYNNTHATPFRRPRRSAPWLDSWQGQLLSALGLAALPIATIAAALWIFPRSPLFSLAYVFDMLSLLVWFAAFTWALQ